MAKQKSTDTDLSAQSVALAEFAAKALIATEQLGIKKRVVDGFSLDAAEGVIAADLPGLSATVKRKLAMKDSNFTVADTASIMMALAESLLDGQPLQRLKLLFIAKKLINCLETNVVPDATATAKKPKLTDALYQFKITLLDSKPPIWRRIQIQDCTLDKLHGHIQMAMGWTNSHLHQFEIRGERYGNPELLNDEFEEVECVDSTRTLLSEILPKNGKRFAFRYEYDFGDDWMHEVLFEGIPLVDNKAKYPLCLEGERACPPEDCGGPWGYADYLAAIADPGHEQHEEMLKWRGPFDPEAFDAKQATKEMRKVK